MSNGRRKKKVSRSRRADSRLSKRSVDRMPSVPPSVGPKIQRDGEEPLSPQIAPTSAIVPAGSSGAGVRISETQLRYEEIVERADAIIALGRNASIQADYEDIKHSNLCGLPPEIISVVDKVLESYDLTLARHDRGFWEYLAYCLGSAESISIEAIISALELSVADASTPLRRTNLYAELVAARKIKRIRDAELRIKTDRVAIRIALAKTVSEGDRFRLGAGRDPASVEKRKREELQAKAHPFEARVNEIWLAATQAGRKDYTPEEKAELLSLEQQIANITGEASSYTDDEGRIVTVSPHKAESVRQQEVEDFLKDVLYEKEDV